MLTSVKFKASELKGIKSVRVLQVTSTLLLGSLMLPVNMGKTYDNYFEEIMNLDREDQAQVLTDAIQFVELKDEEIQSILSFVQDKNGVQIDKSNIDNYNPAEIMDMVLTVCLQVFDIDVFFCHKKN